MRISYTHIMMPNKTIYVKDSDLPLFEQAQELLGDSVSALFADFLKERVGKVNPEDRMKDLAKQIARKRAAIKLEPGIPKFVDEVYAEADGYARKALKSLRAGEIKQAKTMYHAAIVYYGYAERDLKEAKKFHEEIGKVLEG